MVQWMPFGEHHVWSAEQSSQTGHAALLVRVRGLSDAVRHHEAALQQNPETVAETPGWPLSIDVQQVRAAFPITTWPGGRARAHWCHHTSLQVAKQPPACHNDDLLLLVKHAGQEHLLLLDCKPASWTPGATCVKAH